MIDGVKDLSAASLLQALLASATDAIAVSDHQSGRYVLVSDSYCAITGFAREELIGRTSVELGLVADHQTRARSLRGAIEGISGAHELELHRKDGCTRVLQFSAELLAGGPLMLTISRDVTDRRRLDEELHASERRFRTSVESMLDAFTIISPVRDQQGEIVDFRYEYANAAYCALLGVDREQVLGRRGSELVPGFPKSERFAIYREASLHGGAHRIEDVIPTAGPGDATPGSHLIEISIVAMGEDLVVSGRDVTERVRAERQIRQLNRDLDRRAAELEAANREIESFSYSVAHDLRTPLRAIAGFSELLGRGGHVDQGDERGSALLQRISSAAGRMGELIDALLQLAQLSRARLRIARVDLSAIAAEIAEQLRSGGEQREVEFVIEPGMEAAGDPSLVAILLRCLLENAWKYSSGRERARIDVTQDGAGGMFVVRDNGAGFDMAYAEQLFKPFARLHRQDEFPGTGVGLATAERIIHRHGGTLRGEGEVGRGAAFYFSLPPHKESQG